MTRPRSPSYCAHAALCALLVLASCGPDERGLSFELGRSTSAGSAGRSGGAGGNPAGGSSNGGSSNGGSSSEAGDAGDANGEAGQSTSGGSSSTGGNSSAGAGGDAVAMPGPNTLGGSAGSGGTASAGGGNGGAAGAGATGGAPFESPCGDLNDNRVDDCEETLLQNSRFDSAVTGWQAEGSLQQAWVATNARPVSSSGSLSLVNGSFIANSPVFAGQASDQCLVAWGDDTYELGARVLIKAGQGSGSAAVDLTFYGNDGCQGTLLGGKTVARTELAGSWQVTRGQVKLPAATRSVTVRLTVSKPLGQQAPFEALFDDVLAVKK